MVMDLLGPDMEHLLEFLNKRTFTAKTGKSFPLLPTRLSHGTQPTAFSLASTHASRRLEERLSFQEVILHAPRFAQLCSGLT